MTSQRENSLPLLAKMTAQPTPRRLNLANHFTASGLVISHAHILLVHHRRIGSWVPPGGHIEAGELPHEACVREVFEETGVEVEVLTEPMPETGDPHAFFMHRPLCLHAVHAAEKEGDFYHLDLAYLCAPKTSGIGGTKAEEGEAGEGAMGKWENKSSNLPQIKTIDEVHDARWFSLDQLTSIPLAKNVIEIVGLVLPLMKS